jgi:hypothetical protein
MRLRRFSLETADSPNSSRLSCNNNSSHPLQATAAGNSSNENSAMLVATITFHNYVTL